MARRFSRGEGPLVERAGNLWKVLVEDIGDSAATDGKAPPALREIVAETVVLAAGTLGSTEILLRSRERGLNTSSRLGRGFSGNGDALGFAYDCDLDDGNGKRPPVYGIGAGNVWPRQPDKEAFRPGPCITGIIDMRATENVRDGLVIEDGVCPSGLAVGLSTDLPVRQCALRRPGAVRRRGGPPEGCAGSRQGCAGRHAAALRSLLLRASQPNADISRDEPRDRRPGRAAARSDGID